MADATPWRIDPDTFTLIEPPRPRPQGYTTREFDNQVWPPCPVCGATIEVQPIRMSSLGDSEQLFIPGHTKCPRGCNLSSQ
jgi:hypothetical protein